MIPLLYCALADTVVAEIPEDIVFVHEWGVVELDEGYLEATGTPDGYLDPCGYLIEYYPDVAEAPVIWFHGAMCNGDFIVEIPGGDFTFYRPVPDSLDFHAIPGIEASETHVGVWKDIQLRAPYAMEWPAEEEVLEEIPLLEEFEWAYPLWRDVPGNYVIQPSTGFQDRFLYYECSLNGYEMFSGEYYGYTGPALLFRAYDDELLCSMVTVPTNLSDGEVLTEDEIMAEICDWAGGGLKTSEIKALWYTWMPRLRTRCELDGQTVIVFPLSQEQVESISRLRFVPHNSMQVRYDRLFLGLGAI
jgi:hypothetical protein